MDRTTGTHRVFRQFQSGRHEPGFRHGGFCQRPSPQGRIPKVRHSYGIVPGRLRQHGRSAIQKVRQDRSGQSRTGPAAGGRRKRAGEHRRCGAGSAGSGGRFAIAGIAKKDLEKKEIADKIYLPNRANPVNLGSDGRLLLLLQQIRDEAHRFAITFQRRRRTRATIRSVLDDVPGVGPKRKTALMKHFGSIKKIRAATVNELSELPGINPSLAEAIKQSLT
jgi:hypothetical protein